MPLEIINLDFVPPRGWERMSDPQRDEVRRLHRSSLAYRGENAPLSEYIEVSPSEVIDINSDEYIRDQEIRRRQREMSDSGRNEEVHANINTGMEFDPVRGWIVPDEDPNILNGIASRFEWGFAPQSTRAREISREEAFRVEYAADVERQQKAEQTRIAIMPVPDRDAEERFGDII